MGERIYPGNGHVLDEEAFFIYSYIYALTNTMAPIQEWRIELLKLEYRAGMANALSVQTGVGTYNTDGGNVQQLTFEEAGDSGAALTQVSTFLSFSLYWPFLCLKHSDIPIL